MKSQAIPFNPNISLLVVGYIWATLIVKDNNKENSDGKRSNHA
ncbi:hypothetical protein [Grimontia hollisae]|uniref:Uncharacterized protein n=1 Tax=Grimontia hollisae TaxID=673 RepID=A0A377HMV0_GRIHO|nr:hypothetical protein [Grimontia hollisae]STO57591.1 Uncharacterised protein [Grimontia hollisae]